MAANMAFPLGRKLFGRFLNMKRCHILFFCKFKMKHIFRNYFYLFFSSRKQLLTFGTQYSSGKHTCSSKFLFSIILNLSCFNCLLMLKLNFLTFVQFIFLRMLGFYNKVELFYLLLILSFIFIYCL